MNTSQIQIANLSAALQKMVNPWEPGWTPGNHCEWIKGVAVCLHELLPGSDLAQNIVQMDVGPYILTVAADSAWTVSMRLQTRSRVFLTDGEVTALPIDWEENYLTVGSDDVLDVVKTIRRELDPSRTTMTTLEEVDAWINGGSRGPDPRGPSPGHSYYYDYETELWTKYSCRCKLCMYH
jgi:hypothetical protein